MKFTYETQGAITYMVCELENGEWIDGLTLGMLTNNHIPGLAPVLYTEMNGQRFLKYNISAKLSAAQFFGGSMNKQRALTALRNIINTVCSADEYMIDQNTFLIAMDRVFLNVSSCETALICVPVLNEKNANTMIAEFFRQILVTTQFDITEDPSYIAALLAYIDDTQNFTVYGLRDLVMDIVTGRFVPPPVPVPTPAPIPAPAPAPAPVMPEPEMPKPQPVQEPEVPAQPEKPEIPEEKAPEVPAIPQEPEQPKAQEEQAPVQQFTAPKQPTMPVSSFVDTITLEDAPGMMPKKPQQPAPAMEIPGQSAQRPAPQAQNPYQQPAQNPYQQYSAQNAYQQYPYQAQQAYQPQRPAQAFQAQQPAQPYQAQQPAQPYQAQQPAQPYQAQQPAQPFQAQQPAQPFQAQQPAQAFQAQQPAQAFQAQKPAQTPAQPQQPAQKQPAFQPQQPAAPAKTAPKGPGFAIPGQSVGVTAPKAPEPEKQPQAETGEKKMSLFNLLSHYNKENAELYKKQQEEAKAQKKAAADQKNAQKPQKPQKPKKGAAQPPMGGIPGAPVPPVQEPVNAAPAMPQQPQQPQQFTQPQYQPAVQPVPVQNIFNETTVLTPTMIGGETTVLSANPMMPDPALIRTKSGERISINKPVFRIGKEKSYVDYFIADNTAISRSHANIHTENGEYFVEDTNSTNHTYVNGKLINSNVKIKIVSGDKIKLANEDFTFTV